MRIAHTQSFTGVMRCKTYAQFYNGTDIISVSYNLNEKGKKIIIVYFCDSLDRKAIPKKLPLLGTTEKKVVQIIEAGNYVNVELW